MALERRKPEMKKEKYVVLASHPNGGPLWVDKVGTMDEINAYLKDMESRKILEYVNHIFVLADQAEDEVGEWLRFEDGAPVSVIEHESGGE
jgi:hypothetical protein